MAATSAVDICNSALGKLGVEAIVALADSNTRAILCNQVYNKIRDKVLRSHPWKFACYRDTWTVDATAPSFGYDYRYPIAASCLRVLDVDTTLDWLVEGAWLYTNDNGASSLLGVKYIKLITDVTLFDTNFAEALALALAADMAYPLTTSNTLAQQMMKAYMLELAMARSFDAQQQSAKQVQADDWLNSRY